MKYLRFIPGVGLIGALLTGASAQTPVDLLEQAVQWGEQLAREYLPDNALDQLEFPSTETWKEFWNDVLRALESGSLEDLAWMKPVVESGIEWLRRIPAGAPYADWLEQRLDYFSLAEELVRQIPAPPPPGPRPPPPPPPRPGEIKPRPPPTAPPLPPAIRQRRLQSARSRAKWEEKIARRPAPARAADLAPALKKVFRSQALPAELIWLAEVESSFNPEARSPVGAVGLFQFMPATAQRFGLAVQPKDERVLPVKSAEAAARYLRYLHGLFKSWPLALAAYNAGEGRVGRALKTTGGRTFEAIEDQLPVETQMYVPKVLATIAVREKIDPSSLPAPGVL